MAQALLKPSAIEQFFGRLLAFVIRAGIVRGHFFVLEVRGRKTGRTQSLPVDPLELGGRLYLVGARGETNWARNARAAGDVVLVQALKRRRHAVRDLPLAERPAILKAYLDRFQIEVKRFFPVPPGSPTEAFVDLAARYPVFELSPMDDVVR